MEHNRDDNEKKAKIKIDKKIKSVFVGNKTTGKRHIIWTLHYGSCPTEEVPGTLFALYSQWPCNYIFEASNDDLAVDFDLWTVGGLDEYAIMRPTAYPDTEIFLVCFSVADRASFNEIKATWIPEIRQHCPKVPFVLVGCKTDLRDDNPDLETLKSGQIIRHEEGEELAKQIGAVKYFECSCIKNRGVKEMMQEVAKIVLQRREISEKKGKERCIVQ